MLRYRDCLNIEYLGIISDPKKECGNMIWKKMPKWLCARFWQQKLFKYQYHTIRVSTDFFCTWCWPIHDQIWSKILTFDTTKIILLVTKLYWWRPYYEIVISVKTNNPHKQTLCLNHPSLLEKILHSLPSLT